MIFLRRLHLLRVTNLLLRLTGILNYFSIITSYLQISRKAIEAAREAAKKNNETLTEEWYFKNTAFGVAFSQLRKVNPSVYRQLKPASPSNPHYSILLNFEGNTLY